MEALVKGTFRYFEIDSDRDRLEFPEISSISFTRGYFFVSLENDIFLPPARMQSKELIEIKSIYHEEHEKHEVAQNSL
jgi:hypothetical protein